MGNISHVYGSFPKWLKIHVVAIEDSGKINYLDSTLRWYDNYFIAQSKKTQDNPSGADIPDIDSYRNLLSSGYSVFQSKISGKLALLIELEKITGFSCTHTIYSKKGESNTDIFIDENKETENEESKTDTEDPSDIKNNDIPYIVETNNHLTYINFSWETEDPNINPAAVILTDTEWVGEYGQQGKVKFWYKDKKEVKLIENDIENYQLVQYANKKDATNTPSYPNDNYQLVVYGTYNGKVISNTFDIRVLDYDE